MACPTSVRVRSVYSQSSTTRSRSRRSSTLDESLSVEERRERERVVDDWEYTERMRTLVGHAIRLYDDLERFAATNSPAAVGAGGDG